MSERLTRDYANVLSRQQAECLGKHDQARIFGFDTASKPDETATFRIHRVGDEFRYTVDDLEWIEIPGVAEQMAEFARRQRAAAGPTYSAGPYGRSHIVEIITDPADRRGIDARRVGPWR